MRDGKRHAQLVRSPPGTRGSTLRIWVLLAAGLGAALSARGAAAAGPDDPDAPGAYERTIQLGANAFELRVHHASSLPGSSTVTGEGSLATQLPGEGELTLRVPWVVAQTAAVGTAQVAASYDLAREGALLPKIAVTARVDLPTAPGARGAHPGLRASVAKQLGPGLLEAVHVESECWNDQPTFTPSCRAAVGSSFRLRPATHASLDLVSIRPGPRTVPKQNLAQLDVSQRLDPATSLHLGLAAALAESANPLRATLGLERRF